MSEYLKQRGVLRYDTGALHLSKSPILGDGLMLQIELDVARSGESGSVFVYD